MQEQGKTSLHFSREINPTCQFAHSFKPPQPGVSFGIHLTGCINFLYIRALIELMLIFKCTAES